MAEAGRGGAGIVTSGERAAAVNQYPSTQNPRSTVVEGFGQGLNTQVVELAGCHFAKDRHRLRNA